MRKEEKRSRKKKMRILILQNKVNVVDYGSLHLNKVIKHN